MECFLPSEIARIVLGYLKDEGCNKAYKVFLSESAHLQEYTTFLHRGLEYPTRIGGKGLIEMLEDYGRIKLYGKYSNFSCFTYGSLWARLSP
ncbi:hypothetical protein LSAT2_022954 [Lamellibrachia satsuma]|nr:hypothetical protein LSAT2_022954 [Lamellibrachia satsuma]